MNNIKVKLKRTAGALLCLCALASGFSESTAHSFVGAYDAHDLVPKDSLVNLLKYVNGLQGTNSDPGYSTGNIYPAIALPFGMNFWSPQTGKNGDGWKYQYQAGTIRGFGETHQCSPWMNDYGVFSLMPVAENL